MPRRFFFKVDFPTNVFGADMHIRVGLWRTRRKDDRLKFVQSWSYAYGITPVGEAIANRRAENRIKRLRAVYAAEPL